MILVDLEMPKDTFECPFMEVDAETDVPYCYFKEGKNCICSGLLRNGCFIKGDLTNKVLTTGEGG